MNGSFFNNTATVAGELLSSQAGQPSGVGGATALSQLTDVNETTAPLNGQVLTFNGAVWVPAAGLAGPAGPQGLPGLSGVSVAGPQGVAGSTGATGAQGAPGVGSAGSAGATGAPGTNGTNGATGAQGPAGGLSSGTTLPLGFVLPGKPVAGAVFNLVVAVALTIATSLAGSVTYCGTPPAANAVFTVNRISGGVSSSIGTITLTPAGTAILSTSAAVNLLVGDVLQLGTPASQDANLADVGITVLTTKT